MPFQFKFIQDLRDRLATMANRLGVTFENSLGLNKDLLQAIQLELAPLEKDLAARATRYVVDDADADVLIELRGLSNASDLLLLATNPYQLNPAQRKSYGKAMSARRGLLEGLAGAPPAVLVRMAEVYAACSTPTPVGYRPPAGWPDWLTVILVEIIGDAIYTTMFGAARDKNNRALPITMLEEGLRAAGCPPELCLQTILNIDDAHAIAYSFVETAQKKFSGWKAYAERYPDLVRDLLINRKADAKLFGISRLREFDLNFAPFVPELVQLATGSAKTVREAATTILSGHVAEAQLMAEGVLVEGGADQRNEAAQLIWRLGGPGATELLSQHAAKEASERVRQTINKLLAAPTAGEEGLSGVADCELPPLAVEIGVIDLPATAKQGLSDYLQAMHAQASKEHEESLAKWNDTANRPKWMTKPTAPKPFSRQHIDEVISYVEGKAAKYPEQVRNRLLGDQLLGDWLAPPDVRLSHVVRLLVALGRMHFAGPRSEFWYYDQRDLESYRERCEQRFGLRELDAVVASLPQGKAGLVASAYLTNNTRWQSFCDWEPDAVWPAFADKLQLLQQYLGPSPNAGVVNYANHDYLWNEKRNNAFRLLAMFPQLPALFIAPLWDLALGEGKVVRPLAQKALATIPGKSEKIIVALADGKQSVRSAAAEWLGKLGDSAAIDPLRKAYKKEKQESVKGVMLTALEALGADVSEFFDRKRLAAEATAGVAKFKKKGIDWLNLEAIPALHWDDSGKAVPPEIVQWWVVQAIQQKTPTPGPLLRRYLAMCRCEEVREFAKQLLQWWIAADTRTLSFEDASAKAKADSDTAWAQHAAHGGWYVEYYQTKENLYRQLLQNYADACLGSAIAQKGILAIVAAGGGSDCAQIAEQYLRKWYGLRLAQSKSLLEAMAWIEDPLAIQVLLTIATRFRTKALRTAAEEHVNALAERHHWTIDQLADRTLPDAGFEREVDEQGAPVGHAAALLLDYGPRKFQVTLDDSLTPVIAREDGQLVKSLPSPGKFDDESLAKAAQKQFSQAKKTVKEVVKRQSERLYEALCTQRSWLADDWRRYLADHPIVGRLCVRVVWAAFDGEGEDAVSLGCFRPLEDGTLTNEKDEEFSLPATAAVKIAHACNTDANVGAAWSAHLRDYDVTPLFPQFGREVYALPEENANDTELDDFKGHCLTTFQLRGKATKAGFVRGEAQDGGCFMEYRKPFPSLAIEAVLEFTGSTLPEEDVPAALTCLYFIRTRKDGSAVGSSWRPDKLTLGKVPPVLLSECRNDVALIAAAGSGFDPEWEKRGYF